MSTSRNFLGRGWAFPVVPARGAGLGYVEGADCVERSIRIILDTEPGERAMRPTFGCGLRRYLMKPNSAAVRALMQQDVQTSLANFEPRITLRAVQVVPSDDEPSRVDIHIAYLHTRDRRPGNLVYPFYLE
jgi:phage baseplate assembly protein W